MNSACTIQEGNSEKRVLRWCGIPDVVSEESGDLQRWYPGGATVEYKWPWSALKKFYYLETETIIDIQYGKVKSIRTMSEEDKAMVLDTLGQIRGQINPVPEPVVWPNAPNVEYVIPYEYEKKMRMAGIDLSKPEGVIEGHRAWFTGNKEVTIEGIFLVSPGYRPRLCLLDDEGLIWSGFDDIVVDTFKGKSVTVSDLIGCVLDIERPEGALILPVTAGQISPFYIKHPGKSKQSPDIKLLETPVYEDISGFDAEQLSDLAGQYGKLVAIEGHYEYKKIYEHLACGFFVSKHAYYRLVRDFEYLCFHRSAIRDPETEIVIEPDQPCDRIIYGKIRSLIDVPCYRHYNGYLILGRGKHEVKIEILGRGNLKGAGTFVD